MKIKSITLYVLCFALIFSLQSASAYVGPGAGLSAIGTVLALIGAILLGIVGFLWYPIKRLLRAIRKPDDQVHSHDKTNASHDN